MYFFFKFNLRDSAGFRGKFLKVAFCKLLVLYIKNPIMKAKPMAK